MREKRKSEPIDYDVAKTLKRWTPCNVPEHRRGGCHCCDFCDEQRETRTTVSCAIAWDQPAIFKPRRKHVEEPA